MNKELLALFAAMPEETIQELNKFGRQDKLDKIIQAAIGTITAVLLANTISGKTKAFKIANAEFYDTLGIKKPNLKAKDIKKLLNKPIYDEKGVRIRIKAINFIQRSKVKSIIGQQIIQGKGIRQTASIIKKELKLKFMSQADRIARTETLRAVSIAQDEGFQDLIKRGFKAVKVWLNAGDERVRGLSPSDQYDHVSLEGLESNNEGVFEINQGAVSEVLEPRMSGVAGFDINCRCTTATTIVE